MIISVADRLKDVKEYYFSKKLAEIARMKAEGRDMINAGIGNPDFAPSENTIDALIKEAKKPSNHGYQSYRSLIELRSAMSEWMERIYGTRFSADSEILPLIGSKEGIMHISMTFLNKGDAVLVPNPGYPTYSSVSNLLQADIRTYELSEENNWEIDIDALEKQDLSKVKLMWVNFPNMPTGAKGSVSMFERLIALAKKEQFLIVNDNPYSLILNDSPSSLFQIEGAKEVALELNSMSKSHNMAGWRVGWLSGDEEYINAILRVKSNVDTGMYKPLQLAAAEALTNSWDWHKEQNKVYARRRDWVRRIYDLLGCEYDVNQVGMFVWAKVPTHIEEVEAWVDKILYETNVFFTPGFIFGSMGNRYIRVSLCTDEERLEEIFDRVKKFVGEEVTS